LREDALLIAGQVDGKSADMSPAPGSTSGTDFAGVVVALGPGIARENEIRASNGLRALQLKDRVMGGVFGNNPLRPDNGAFGEYVAVPARLVWHVPNDMDFSTAATLPAAIATVGMSLFQYMQLPFPGSGVSATAPYVLVYGGGTATGALAIQVLRLAGFTPITTCSKRSAELARHHGAAATWDYRSPTCGADIREYTNDSLQYALDCTTDAASMATCYDALRSVGGRYIALDSFPLRGHTRRSVSPDFVVTYSQFGHPIQWAAPYNLDARPEDRRFAEAWYVVAQRYLDQGKLEPHPKEERRGGLASVLKGIDDVRKGHIAGRKLSYPVCSQLCV
jgi:aspyridone synthetase trans-acting enoyl reductase